MTDELDLWTSRYAETGDDIWMAYEYNDDAVQFIKQDSHDIIWQGRTVVDDSYSRGRLEAHYSHSTDAVYLMAATHHSQPPEYDLLLDGEEFAFDFEDLQEPTIKHVLRTVLAEWAQHLHLAELDYPPSTATATLTDLTTGDGTDAKNTPFDERSPQEIFDVGVARLESLS